MIHAQRWFVIFALAVVGPLALGRAGPSDQPSSHNANAAPASDVRPAAASVLVSIRTTAGEMIFALDMERAPRSVSNFLHYAESGYYRGTIFHRVIPGFIVQGGGYTPTLRRKTAGLGTPIKNEWDNGLKNVRGTIGAARVPGKPDSATSEFYINLTDNPRLDEPQEDGAGYAVFGHLVSGKDILQKIAHAKLHAHPRFRDPSNRPVTPKKAIIITSVFRVKRNAAGRFIPLAPVPRRHAPTTASEGSPTHKTAKPSAAHPQQARKAGQADKTPRAKPPVSAKPKSPAGR